MNEVLKQYAPTVPLSSFAQMGYLTGRIATDALLSIDGPITKAERQRGVRERSRTS
jgi:hypothetical protein